MNDPHPASAPVRAVPRTVIPLAPERSMRRPWRVFHVLGLMLALPSCGVPRPETTEPDIAALMRRDIVRDALHPSIEGPLKISYLRGGTRDGPQVIYVHGTPGQARGWADYLMPSEDRFDAMALDRPGFGESGPERGAVTSLAAQAAAVAELMVEKKGIKPILVGHSLGGPIVARVAVDYPDRVGGLVIAAGSLDPALEKIHPLQWVGEWPGVRSVLPRAIRNANRELIALEDELRQMAGRLHEIALPIVIVHGTEDDLVPFENVAFMERAFTGTDQLEIVVLEELNHFLPWNSKPVLDEAVRRVAELMASR